jgi:hypothetical protein
MHAFLRQVLIFAASRGRRSPPILTNLILSVMWVTVGTNTPCPAEPPLGLAVPGAYGVLGQVDRAGEELDAEGPEPLGFGVDIVDEEEDLAGRPAHGGSGRRRVCAPGARTSFRL